MQRAMIIGLGGIAPAHVEAYLEFGGRVEITALADPNTERGEQLKAKYALGCRVVSDYSEALADCDIVSVCTPPSTHRDIALACLGAGKHLLLEKPMAPTLAECDEIMVAARAAKKLVSVVAQSRFISGIANAIALVKSGEYGKTLFTSVNSCWYRGSSYYDLAWRGRWESEGGGCTMSQAVHHIDLLLWAKGMPSSVTAIVANLAHDNSEEEDVSCAILRYPDGTLAQLTCSLVHHGEQQTFCFQMEKAGVTIPFSALASGSRSNGFPLDDEQTAKRLTDEFNALPPLEYEHHAGQVQNLLDAAEHGAALAVDAQSGRNAIELIMSIYLSGMTGKTVELPLQKDCGFYTREDVKKNAVHFNEKTRSVAAFEDTLITSFKGKF